MVRVLEGDHFFTVNQVNCSIIVYIDLESVAAQGFQNDSTIAITSHMVTARVTHNEELVYVFNLGINQTIEETNFTLIFNGSDLSVFTHSLTQFNKAK